MKSRILIILIIFFRSLIYPIIAQNSWAPIGAEWYYGIKGSFIEPPSEHYELFKSVKDSTINDTVYTVIEKVEYTFSDTTLLGYDFMYKSNNEVYIYLNGQDYILYDFSADKGDSWETRVPYEHYGISQLPDSIIEITVDSVSSLILVNDTLKTLFTSTNSPWKFEGPIIENIGNRYMFPHIWGLLDQNVPYLRCYIDDSIFYSIMPCDTIFKMETELIKRESNADFLIYPNPVNNYIYIKCNNEKYNNIYIELFDMQGRCIFNKKLINYTNEYILNVNNLNKGIYFILIRNENINIHYSKILIK